MSSGSERTELTSLIPVNPLLVRQRLLIACKNSNMVIPQHGTFSQFLEDSKYWSYERLTSNLFLTSKFPWKPEIMAGRLRSNLKRHPWCPKWQPKNWNTFIRGRPLPGQNSSTRSSSRCVRLIVRTLGIFKTRYHRFFRRRYHNS